ncbi:MAG: AMP-binding protein, partial [Rikenellaceae bacterium]
MELIDYTLGGIIEKWATETPDKEFLVSPYLGVRYTYAEFSERVDSLALAFGSMGVDSGKKVGIWATNHPDWITVFFATARLGAVLVTVNTNYKATELEYIMNNADIHTMCLIDGYRDSNYVEIMHTVVPEMLTMGEGEQISSAKLPELRNAVYIGEGCPVGMHNIDDLVAHGATLPREAYDAFRPTISCHDVVNMQYTSGTTGFPKGVLLTHYNILNNGKATGEFMRYSVADKLLVCVPMFHCFGCVLALCAVITHGATMVMLEEFDAHNVLESIHKERCTILYGVPTMFIAELNHPLFDTFDLKSLRTGIMAGAVCPIDTMNAVMNKMNCNVISIYG